MYLNEAGNWSEPVRNPIPRKLKHFGRATLLLAPFARPRPLPEREVMLPLLVLGGVCLAAGIIVGRFRTPRPIDARMTAGALMILSGVIFLVQALLLH